jgi:hypothetical protein
MMQEVNEEIQPGNLNQNMQENQNDGDGANMEPDVVDDVVPHHPDQPQDNLLQPVRYHSKLSESHWA